MHDSQLFEDDLLLDSNVDNEVELHWGQSEVYNDLMVDKTTRYATVCCSRGWGKSYLAGTTAASAVMELMALPPYVPHKDVYIVAPTYDQAVDIYFPLLMNDLGLRHYTEKDSRDLGRLWFPNNTSLRLLSYESVERMRGKGSYLTVWDEVSSCKKGIKPSEAWNSVIRPCMATRWSPQRAKFYKAPSAGRGLFISTPKGYNFFHTLFSMHDPEWKSYHYSYLDSPILDPVEIEKQKNDMDPIEFASEYLADFKESGNSVFYMFDRQRNVRDVEKLGEGEDVHVSIDFNVALQCSAAFTLRGGQMQYFKAFKGHPDTDTLAKVLRETFPNRQIFAYPDPSGKARKTSAPVGQTDFTILESYGITVLARSASPALVDSSAAVNRKLCNANGRVDMIFDPSLKELIASMERTKWMEKDIAVIDKSEGVEHYSDGVRYATEYLFPIRRGVTSTKQGHTF